MTNANPTANHVARIKRDLKKAGATKYGLLKLESRYLPKLIHPDEEIGGVIYGRYDKGSAMLVATDRRVIFLDRMLFYTVFKEITYDVVSGISQSIQRPFFASVVLHTRLGDFQLKFVNMKASERFVHYIETRRVEHVNGVVTDLQPAFMQADTLDVDIPDQAAQFLREHDLATLSTLDNDGHPYGSVVYYTVGDDNTIYIITKSETEKAHNILKHENVGITVYDAANQQTAQLQGKAKVESDEHTRQYVFDQIIRTRMDAPATPAPPVTKLSAGAYVVIAITATTVKYRDFSKEAVQPSSG